MGDGEDEPGLWERAKAWLADHPVLVFVAFALPLTMGPVLVYAAWQILGEDEDDEAEVEVEVPVDP